MTTMEQMIIQVYQIFIKATPQVIWDAITKPEFTAHYFFGAQVETTAEVGSPFDRLEGAPKTAANVAGLGWMMVLSGMKTLLETGASLAQT